MQNQTIQDHPPNQSVRFRAAPCGIDYTRTCAPTLSSNATVILPGDLTLLAQNEIVLETGFTVAPGGLLTANIAPACDTTYQYQYFLTDHTRRLGKGPQTKAVRVTFADPDTNGVADLLEEHHYYPFGLEMERGNAVDGAGVEQRYRYNGIEHNEETGLDLAAFRSYDAALGRWMQIDPRAEKYVGMSPYNGMGNNPILYSDPMGDTIRIQTGEGQYVNYTVGMEYKGDNEFVGSIVNSLNTIAGTEAGSAVVSDLSGAEGHYDFTSEKPSLGAASYRGNGDGSGVIRAGGDPSAVLDVAHELFHGYQDLNAAAYALEGNTLKSTTGAEVGAYLFEQVINNSLNGYADLPMTGNGRNGSTYSQTFSSLLYDGHSDVRFRIAAQSFKDGGHNASGIYDNARVRAVRSAPISKFLPLKF